MLVITRETIRSLKQTLANPAHRDRCQGELEKMLEIKSTLLWRADASRGCCGWQLAAQLAWEVETIEKTIQALGQGDVDAAAAMLETLEKDVISPD